MNDIDIIIIINVPLLISRWFHIAAFIVAIGGAAFTRFAFIPGASESLSGDAGNKLGEAVTRRWAKFVHASIVLLVLTGIFNFYTLAIRGAVEPMPYHAIFGVKLLLSVALFFIAQALVGKTAVFETMRRKRARWLTALLGLAALIVLLSGLLNQVRTTQA